MTKVLIVEDEDIIARMYEKALGFDGYEVSVALGGEEGLKKIKSEKPDFILLDVMMPEPDGIEVLEKIKMDPDTKDIPVAILTNLSGKHDSQLAFQKGANDFWIKSDIKIKDLGKKIRGIIDEQRVNK